MTTSSLLLLVAAMMAVLVAAGCGTDDLEAFRDKQLKPLEQRIDRARAELAARLRSVRAGVKEDADALRKQIAPLVEAAREAAALDAPEAAAKAQRAYTSAANALVRELRRFADALEKGSERALERAAARTRDALGALQAARIAFDQAVGE